MIHTILSILTYSITLVIFLSTCLTNTEHSDGVRQRVKDKTSSSNTHLNVTAILSSPAPPHHSFVRCLRSPYPFTAYPTIGSSLFLSNTSNMTLVTLPASPSGEGEGWHNPPHPMWFMLLSGRARVWMPTTFNDTESGDVESLGGQEVWIEAEGERRNQILLALNVVGPGHKTWYYGGEGSTVSALQVPLGDRWEEQAKRWETVSEGPCRDLMGAR